jgi:ubiquinone/menaquinone biosynthesis C-methylase UbiE
MQRSPVTHTYVHAQADPDAERRRLRLLQQRYDRETFRRLDLLGPPAGASCLEVGAGAGSVARGLSRAVGPAGRVVATDIDLRFLDATSASNLEVWQHDILTDPLPRNAFDLVHCRALLCHLPEPEQALTRMVAALRPGGRLLVEEADYVSCAAATRDHPHAAAFERTVAAVMAHCCAQGLFDPYLGRRLAALVADTGLTGCGSEGIVFVRPGASGPAELLARSVEPHGPELIETGRVSAADFAATIAALGDTEFSFLDALSFAAWGRR